MIINFLHKALPLFAHGALTTLLLTSCALSIGLMGGIFLGIINSNKLKVPGLSYLITGYIFIIRGTPVYVQVLLAYFALPEIIGVNLSPFWAGVIALGINSIAYVAEIIRGGINSVHEGQWDACHVLCYSKVSTLFSVIIPQALRATAPALTNEIAALIKETSIVSMIGVVELTKVANNLSAQTLDPLSVYTCAGLGYLSMTTVITLIAYYCERKLS
jgi:His/Glu/Gln/Arg/opine family amino acid ABC transporter permease subunit